MNQKLRFAVLLLAAIAFAIYRWPAGEPETGPLIESQDVTAQTEQVREAPEAVAELPPSTPPAAAVTVEAPRAAPPPVRSSARGLVRNASGIPMEGVEIIATNHTANGIELARSRAVSDYRGEFRLEQLLPGRIYRLSVTPRDGHAAYDLESFVAGKIGQLQDIVLRRVELVDVDGMVVDVDRAPVADFEFVVGSLSTEFPVRTVKSDSTGFFSLRDFPAGEIRIATKAADYFRIQGLELRPDEYRNLTLIIDRGSYHLAGWVSDANGASVVEAQVILKSSFDAGDYHSISNRATLTDPGGAFEFAQLGGNPATLSIYAKGFETRLIRHRFASYSDYLRIELTPADSAGQP